MTQDIQVTVYEKTICGECVKTMDLLDELGVTYDVINIEETPGALDQLKAAGFRSAPVVITSRGGWGGHKEEKIRELFG